MEAARGDSWGHRDATGILLAYRHGLRSTELVALRWDDIDVRTSNFHVRRRQGRHDERAPAGGQGAAGAASAAAGTPEAARTVHIFVSERLASLSVAGNAWLPALARPPAFHSSSTATCCAIAAAVSGHWFPICGPRIFPVLTLELIFRGMPRKVSRGESAPMLLPLAGGSGTVINLGEVVMILELHRQGLKISAIARQLSRSRYRADCA
jgi:hypothetical protein